MLGDDKKIVKKYIVPLKHFLKKMDLPMLIFIVATAATSKVSEAQWTSCIC